MNFIVILGKIREGRSWILATYKDTDCVINSTVRVADVMERVFVSVTPDMTIKEVLRLFVKYRLQAAPVVDENDYLLGIISSADLMYNSNAPKIPRSFPIIGQKILRIASIIMGAMCRR